MSSRTEIAPIVNPNRLYRRGQSLRVLTRDSIGVVVEIRGRVYELALWPVSRVEAFADELAELGWQDACPPSLADSPELAREAYANGNRCMPRARDGRCHWCDRELSTSHVDDESGSEVSDGR
jgi:hypothetical protein